MRSLVGNVGSILGAIILASPAQEMRDERKSAGGCLESCLIFWSGVTLSLFKGKRVADLVAIGKQRTELSLVRETGEKGSQEFHGSSSAEQSRQRHCLMQLSQL